MTSPPTCSPLLAGRNRSHMPTIPYHLWASQCLIGKKLFHAWVNLWVIQVRVTVNALSVQEEWRHILHTVHPMGDFFIAMLKLHLLVILSLTFTQEFTLGVTLVPLARSWTGGQKNVTRSRTTFTNLLAMMPHNQVGGFIVSNQIHITHITQWTYVGVHLHVPLPTHVSLQDSAVGCKVWASL